MSLKKTALLAIILVGVLLYIFRVLEPGKQAEEQAKYIFNKLAQDKITSLHVTSAKGEYTLLQQATAQPSSSSDTPDPATVTTPAPAAASKWQLKGLEQAPLDQAKLNSIISAITSLTSDNVIESADIDKDKSVYGLAQPDLTLELKTAAKSYTIKFGKENAYVGKRYVSIEPDGPALMLAADSLYATAAVKADDIRSKMPLQLMDSEVKSLEIKSAKDTLKVVRAEDSTSWKLAAPIEAKAADATVLQLIRDLRNLRADEFIESTPQNLSTNGLDTAPIEVKIEFSNSRPTLSLKIAPAKSAEQSKPAFFVVDQQPGIYKTSNFDQASIVKSPLEMRDREMFGFERTKLKEISFQIEGANDRLHLINKSTDGKWKVDDMPADEVFVGELLGNLSGLKAADFQSAPKQAFDKPQLSITLRLDGTNEQTLLVGAETKSGSKLYFARSSARSEDFVISAETLKLITPRVEALQAQPTPTAISAVTTSIPEAKAPTDSSAPSQPTGGASG